MGTWTTIVGLAGCPPRETLIEISPSGAATLLNACGAAPLDVSTLCDGLTATCEQAGGAFGPQCRTAEEECRDLEQKQLDATCAVVGLKRPPTAMANTRMSTRIALVTMTNGAPQVRDVTPCTPVTYQCEGPLLDETCGAAGLNAAITQTIPADGLGFDGLADANDTVPLLLMYADNDGDAITCAGQQLFACGALDQRIPGEDTYDLVCASCQAGAAATVESAPCLTTCFLNICADLATHIEALDAG